MYLHVPTGYFSTDLGFSDFRTYINRPATSWIDDYFDWAAIPSCCKYFPANNSFCPHSDNDICENCTIDKNSWDRPDVQSFSKFLPYFLEDSPDEKCSKAGHAAYSDVLTIIYIFVFLPMFLILYVLFRLFRSKIIQ